MASYTDDINKPKMSQEERDKLMQEFLSKGGKIISSSVGCKSMSITF